MLRADDCNLFATTSAPGLWCRARPDEATSPDAKLVDDSGAAAGLGARFVAQRALTPPNRKKRSWRADPPPPPPSPIRSEHTTEHITEHTTAHTTSPLNAWCLVYRAGELLLKITTR